MILARKHATRALTVARAFSTSSVLRSEQQAATTTGSSGEKKIVSGYNSDYEVRNQFVHEKNTQPRFYLGVRLAKEDGIDDGVRHFFSGLASLIQFFKLSPDAPSHFSETAKDIWTRATNALQMLRRQQYNRLENPRAYDEYEMTKQQYAALDSSDLTAEERAAVQSVIDELDVHWRLALKIDGLSHAIGCLERKYHNTYAFPTEDYDTLCEIVDAYNALRAEPQIANNRTLRDILDNNLLSDIMFLNQKINLPQLALRYPDLFKNN